MSRLFFIVVLGCFLTASPAAASTLPDIPVTLPDGSEASIDASLRAQLPEITVSATSHGETHAYTGVDLMAALKSVGLQSTESLRGAAMGLVLVAEGSDGYTVTFSLAELDPTIGNRQVLLVDTMDTKPLPANTGPWRLVVPGDGRPTRWVWGLKRIAVRDVRE